MFFILFSVFGLMTIGSAMAVPVQGVEADTSHFSNLPENIRILPQMTTEDVQKKIEDYTRSVDVLESEISRKDVTVEKTTANALRSDIDNYKTLTSIYQRILAALNKKTSLEKDLQLINEDREHAETSISSPPPYSLGFYDSHMAELSIAEQRQQDLDISNRLARTRLLDISRDIEENEKNIRLLKENQTTFITEAEKISAGQELKQIADQQAVLTANAHLERINLTNLETEKKIADRQVSILYRQMTRIKQFLSFDKEDLQKQLDGIDVKRTELEALLSRVLDEQNQVEAAWKNAREAADESAVSSTADAWLKAREAWRKTYQAVLEQTSEIIRLLDFNAQIWRLRYALLNNQLTAEELAEWKTNTRNHISEMNHTIVLEQNYQNTLRQQIIDAERQLQEAGPGSVLAGHYKTRIDAMTRLAKRRVEYISALLENQQLVMRFQDEINSRLDRNTLMERLTGLFSRIQNTWNYEVWVIDGNGVTVRKLMAALVLLILGLLSVKILFNTVFKRLLVRTQLRETTASTIQKILSYFAYLMVLLFALRIVNIPLAAFAFFGGAIAIGIGFGAQNLINNFISGFILMGERPISIGDLIEIEGVLGKVEEIGARCTRIRTGENIHIMVPNSSLLEKNITNWTLSDTRIRAHVSVGVVYGSDVKKVTELMIQSVRDNAKTFQTPSPFVLFQDFGDNALMFEVYFWISINSIIERRIIESEIRFRIETLFNEAAIVIAFPQRDVHLDASRPIRLELVGKDETKL
jgi:small-conductance mechanosensitive channel